ncbi:hypothetical protein [Foetidibacter luteolus]|uniref:hypothetical protein n=1 Tax=Foetidibacter luteolus TaxID=2608880 RepID=UPI00129B04C5|nr:hypothetical protein [Foetidibacter luteolus]
MEPIQKTKNILATACLLVCFFTNCKKNELTPSDTDLQNIQADKSKARLMLNNPAINTFAGSNVYGYAGDGGPVAYALLNSPSNVYVDKIRRDLYISDLGNNVIRKVDGRTGRITTVAGNGNAGFSGDGGPATQASLAYAFHTATDNAGNLYISDLANNRIRKVDRRTGIINTIAGTGVPDFNGDGHKALETNLNEPFGLVFDNNGNLIFSDGTGLRVRKLNMQTKIISTIAGSGDRGYAGDGGSAKNANFNFIWNITVDEECGDIYVSDEFNYRVRKINALTDKISTVAGNGVLGNSGMGVLATEASFAQPVGIAIDKNGNLFISDEILSQVYAVDKKTGIIKLVSGNGTNGFAGDGGPAVNAILYHPNSLSFDADGNLLICDGGNNRIRKIGRLNSVN